MFHLNKVTTTSQQGLRTGTANFRVLSNEERGLDQPPTHFSTFHFSNSETTYMSTQQPDCMRQQNSDPQPTVTSLGSCPPAHSGQSGKPPRSPQPSAPVGQALMIMASCPSFPRLQLRASGESQIHSRDRSCRILLPVSRPGDPTPTTLAGLT